MQGIVGGQFLQPQETTATLECRSQSTYGKTRAEIPERQLGHSRDVHFGALCAKPELFVTLIKGPCTAQDI